MTTRTLSTLSAFAVAFAIVIAMPLALGLGAGLVCGPIRGIELTFVVSALVLTGMPAVLLVPAVVALMLMTFVRSQLLLIGGRRLAIGVGITALVLLLAGWGLTALNTDHQSDCTFRMA